MAPTKQAESINCQGSRELESLSLLVGMKNNVAAVGNSTEAPQKLRPRVTI